MRDLSSLAYNVFKDPQGVPIARGKLHLFLENSNTPAVAFYDQHGKNVFREWPLELDDIGTASIWLEGDKAYRVQVRNFLGSLVLYENSSFRVGEFSLVGSLAENNSHTRAKTMVYTNGVLTSIRCYSDLSKTKLIKTINLIYNITLLSQVQTIDAEDNVVATKTINRDVDGLFLGVDITNP